MEESKRIILAGECGLFSPKVITCFEEAKEELVQLSESKFIFV